MILLYFLDTGSKRASSYLAAIYIACIYARRNIIVDAARVVFDNDKLLKIC